MKRLTRSLTFLVISFVFYSFISKPKLIFAAPVQNLKDSMSTSRLSYFARLGVGVSVNDTILKIATNGNPSDDTANLFVGDTLAIGVSNAGTVLYTVRDIGNTAMIEITGLGNTGALIATNAWSGAPLIATSSAIHTVSFSPMSSVTGGKWQVLIRATPLSGENSADGIPDQGGFDLGATTPSSGATGIGTRLKATDVTCPWSGTASVGTTVILTTANGVNVGSTGPYHVITCALPAGGTNPVGTGTTGIITIGKALASGSQLINPAPALNHTNGKADSSADTYTMFIRHTDNSDTIIDADTTAGKLAVTESVRITAIVDPTITFYIDNVGVTNVGSSRCGSPMGNGAINTTSTTINYGPLNLSAFNDLAHRFSCTTNAKNGFTVQVYQDGPLTNITTGTTIPNTNCDGACTVTAGGPWVTDNTHSEFGYALEVGVTSNGTVLGAGTTAYKAFGTSYTNAQSIMSRTTTPPATEQAYICYRVTASNFQEAGNYENTITFLATATF